MILFRYFIIFAWFCAPLAAHAARPMVTDDARLTKAGSCQVEAWVKAYSGGHESVSYTHLTLPTICSV